MSDISITSTDREILAALGARLRALRKRRGLSIIEAAELSSLDRTTVSRAEHGDNPTLLTIVRLLRVYGRIGAIEAFLPPSEISPMELIRKAKAKSGRRGEETDD